MRADRVASVVKVVRFDRGREFQGGFYDLCRKRDIEKKRSPADSPQFNCSVEPAFELIETAGKAARIHAKERYFTISLWEGDS